MGDLTFWTLHELESLKKTPPNPKSLTNISGFKYLLYEDLHQRHLGEKPDRESAATYPSLRTLLGYQDWLFNRAHPIWESGNHDSMATQEAIINAWPATATYQLQANRATFNQFAVSPDCSLCHSGAENRSHFLLQCKALDDIIAALLPKIQDYILRLYMPQTLA